MQNRETKRCAKCKRGKPLSAFNRRKRSKDGVQARCRECCSFESKNLTGEKKTERNKKVKKWRAKNPEKNSKYLRKYRLKIMYGLTPDDWNALYEEQGGCCAICGIHQSSLNQTLSIDHDHKTNKVRSLLCVSCNSALGMVKENKLILFQMISYIDEHA